MGDWHSTLEGLVVNPSFWEGRQVFITGHTGFKGGWLSLWLKSMGARVTGYSLDPPTRPSLFEVAEVARGINSIHGDIRDLASLRTALSDSDPEVIFHLAAQPLVRRSYLDPLETFSTNIMGTVNLLESLRALQGRRVLVNVTTDKCYENREWLWPYRENEPLGGYDPYSSSKACSELVTSAYRRSFFSTQDSGLRIASARAGNVIGGGDWSLDRLVPDLISAFSRGVPVKIRYPAAIRPWQHVLEPLRGYLMLAEALVNQGTGFDEAFNFGPSEAAVVSVGELVEQASLLWGEGACLELSKESHLHEAGLLKLDISKARSVLGWQPCLDLEESLRLTLGWAKDCLQGCNMQEVTQRQIDHYQEHIRNDLT